MVKFKRGAIEIEFASWMIIALIAGVVIILGILILKGKAFSAVDYIKNLLRFGGK